MGNYGDILAQLKIYQRLWRYIGATQNISAILKYIDLSTKHDKRSLFQNAFWDRLQDYIIFPSKVRSFKNKFQKKINPGNKIAIPIAYRMSSA